MANGGIFDDIDFDFDDDFLGEDEIEGSLPVIAHEMRDTLRQSEVSSIQEKHRRHLCLSQTDWVGQMIMNFSSGERGPKLVAFTQGREGWLNGCRVALRRCWDKAVVDAKKQGIELTMEDRLFIHYQNAQTFTELGYGIMEMWLSHDKFVAKADNAVDLVSAFRRRTEQ